jgi:ATP-dependent RNA helicase DDX51/DBP6
MTKKCKKMQSRAAEVGYADHSGEAGDEHMLDAEEEHKVVLDVDDGKGAPRTEHEETARQLQKKKKKHRKKGKDDNHHNNNNNPAEDSDGESERPRKRHKLPGLDRSRIMHSRSANTDPSRSSPVPSEPLPSASVVSNSPELQSDTQSLLEHRTRIRIHTPTPPPPPLQRFPLPSRPHAPEKSVLASQGLDRALARAQLVDPLLSTPLSFDENGDDVTGLSTKALRRLRDLGIVELFAGVLLYIMETEQY